MFVTGGELGLLPAGQKGDTEGVDSTEEFEETHGEDFCFAMWLIDSTSIRDRVSPRSQILIPN